MLDKSVLMCAPFPCPLLDIDYSKEADHPKCFPGPSRVRAKIAVFVGVPCIRACGLAVPILYEHSACSEIVSSRHQTAKLVLHSSRSC